MIPHWLAHWAWHGIRGAILGGGAMITGMVTAAKRMPLDWEWLLIVAAAAIGFVNGVDSYKQTPGP